MAAVGTAAGCMQGACLFSASFLDTFCAHPSSRQAVAFFVLRHLNVCSLLVHASGQLQSTAQQLREELRSTLSPLRSHLQSAAKTLTAHDTALEDATSVAAAVKLLTGLPDAVADLSARLDELAQAQRPAEGELCANKEHCLALDQQAATAQAQLQVLEASLAALPEQEGRALQQLRKEMLEPIVEVGEGTG